MTESITGKEQNVTQKKSVAGKDRVIFEVAMLAGEILLTSGAETYRVEETMSYILDLAQAKEISAMAILTGLIGTYTKSDGETITSLKRITAHELHLGKIYQVNQISRELCKGTLEIEEAKARLLKLREVEKPVFRNQMLMILICGFFALMVGGGIPEFFFACVSGTALVMGKSFALSLSSGVFLEKIILSFAASLVAIFCNRLYPFNLDEVIIGTLMIQFPGTAITNAIRDTLKGDYLSGGGRALEALMTAVSLAIGSAFGLYIGGLF